VLPFCHELAQIIINDRSFYDLPRKFNIAFDGGGLIGTVEDTNDIGAKAVKVGDDVFLPHRARLVRRGTRPSRATSVCW
jgi:ferredoxin-nitrite reductase